MIDYDKLKIAHELADKLKFGSYYVQLNHGTYNNIVLYYDDEDNLSHEYEFKCIDDLIAKLTELTQHKCKCGNNLDKERSICNECIDRALKSIKPKPKYNLGQKIWKISLEDEPECFTIGEIDCDNKDILYCVNDSWWLEEQLYPSRESLIEAQIDYWNKLLHPTVQESTKEAYENEKEFIKSHADKWNEYWNSQEKCLGKSKEACKHEQCAIPEMVFRCIKCGEFYR